MRNIWDYINLSCYNSCNTINTFRYCGICNTSGGSLATNVDKQTKKANEDYLESEAKIIITETYGEKKGTSKETIINFEKTKVDNLKKQYEKRGGKVPETLKVKENGDIVITNGVLVSFKEVTGLNINEAASLTRD